MKKRKMIYSLLHQITDYKENSHFKKLTHEEGFDKHDRYIHISCFLKTFGYTVPEQGEEDSDKLTDFSSKQTIEVFHTYQRVLKRYYLLYNKLIEAAEALTQPLKLLLANTKYENHFDCVLYHKFLF